MYTGTIVYIDENIENVEIEANNYLEAMRLFHQICNTRININHENIKQTLLKETN